MSTVFTHAYFILYHGVDSMERDGKTPETSFRTVEYTLTRLPLPQAVPSQIILNVGQNINFHSTYGGRDTSVPAGSRLLAVSHVDTSPTIPEDNEFNASRQWIRTLLSSFETRDPDASMTLSGSNSVPNDDRRRSHVFHSKE
jgi:hypothetical protein